MCWEGEVLLRGDWGSFSRQRRAEREDELDQGAEWKRKEMKK